ncbi:MAG: polymer-forming cytoskeletal protein [Candidatus Eisenbacteria bacterium]|nr:polymer-forming cytoskeletal protein [Candidatus Eisenbacteria bacterium]
MFQKEGERTTVGGVNTVIGEGTTLKGDIKVEGSIEVDGDYEGTIDATDTLIVGSSGKVDGDATVANAVIGGHMYGNVFASGKIELRRGSQLLGDIKTRGLVIEDGVVFQGNCQMGDVVEPPTRRRSDSRLERSDSEELEEAEARY